MNKVKKVFYVFVVMIILCSSVFAIEKNLNIENSNSIVSLSSQTVNLNTEFYLILNLSNISYSKFKVEITNTSSLSIDEITEPVSNLSTNNVVTTFIVDKASIGLDKLGVVYTSPSKSAKINFEVKITSLDTSVEDLNTELKSLNLNISNLQSTLTNLQSSLSGIVDTESEDYKTVSNEIEKINAEIKEKEQEQTNLTNKINNFAEETMKETTSINVEQVEQNVFNNDNTDKNSTNMEAMDTTSESNKKSPWGDKDSMMEDEDKEMSSSMRKMMEDMTSLENDLKSANDRISSLTQTETYQGSQNNYLKSLTITGVELKNEFKKTTNNYFATVGADINSITVNATAEDSTAIVTIYGNTNLQNGKNKVLINVTAEDGSVRTYKIYVTKTN